MNRKKLQLLLAITSASLMLPLCAQSAGWDAISIDKVAGDKDPYYGIGSGDTKADAEKNSQKFCVQAGGKNCLLMLSYQECGAYAASKKSSGNGVGSTKKIAEDKAMSECKDSDCSIVVSDCNK